MSLAGLFGTEARETDSTGQESMDSPTHAGLQELLALRAHARRDALPGLARRVTSGGQRISTFRGRGMEFEESRLYQAGDDMRQLDWKVTARSGKPHTKVFREERERPVLLWLDLRPGMFFATRGRFKSVQAIRAAALLAWRATTHGDRVGGMLFGQGQHHEERPAQGHRAVLRWLGSMIEAQSWWPSPSEETDDLQRSLRRLRRMSRPGCLIFLISDFHGIDEVCAEELSILARHCSLVAVEIFDPLERELPPPGRYVVTRGDRRATIDSADPSVTRRYATRVRQRLDDFRDLGRRLRMPILELATNEDAVTRTQLYLPRYWK